MKQIISTFALVALCSSVVFAGQNSYTVKNRTNNSQQKQYHKQKNQVKQESQYHNQQKKQKQLKQVKQEKQYHKQQKQHQQWKQNQKKENQYHKQQKQWKQNQKHVKQENQYHKQQKQHQQWKQNQKQAKYHKQQKQQQQWKKSHKLTYAKKHNPHVYHTSKVHSCSSCYPVQTKRHITDNTHRHHSSYSSLNNTVTYCCLEHARAEEGTYCRSGCSHQTDHYVQILTHRNWSVSFIHNLLGLNTYHNNYVTCRR